ncbi:MAG: hypothetical protein GXO35_00185 [Gammaproteobacteria bacterium]|nr:hypothetical protein [Gammaproteobacteria bacterium]
MSTQRSPDEIRQHYVDEMGALLGEYFARLWQEVAFLYWKWQEFIQLFGSDPADVEVLNQVAPAFFRMIQDMWWRDVVLHIARLTDPPASGRKGKMNFTLMRLPLLIDEPTLNNQVTKELENLKIKVKRFRDWRNRRIAHRDLDLVFGGETSSLPSVGRQHLEEVLRAIMLVMNLIEEKYVGASTRFDVVASHSGARSMLFYLKKGLMCREQEIEAKQSQWS